MKLHLPLACLLLFLGLGIFFLRAGSGHSWEINDLGSFVSIISPVFFILSSLLLFGYYKTRKNRYLTGILLTALLLSGLSIISMIYDLLSHWRNSIGYFIAVTLFLVILLLMTKLIMSFRPKG